VWSAGVAVRRRGSRIYQMCMLVLAIYLVVIVAMVFGRISEFQRSNICIIGLKPYASISLLTYDLFINVLMTSLFVIPILRHKFVNHNLRSIARRTLVASGVALTTSTVNILVLAILQGHEKAWICLASCSADTAVNALVIFWVTSGTASADESIIKKPQPGRTSERYNDQAISLSFMQPSHHSTTANSKSRHNSYVFASSRATAAEDWNTVPLPTNTEPGSVVESGILVTTTRFVSVSDSDVIPTSATAFIKSGCRSSDDISPA